MPWPWIRRLLWSLGAGDLFFFLLRGGMRWKKQCMKFWKTMLKVVERFWVHHCIVFRKLVAFTGGVDSPRRLPKKSDLFDHQGVFADFTPQQKTSHRIHSLHTLSHLHLGRHLDPQHVPKTTFWWGHWMSRVYGFIYQMPSCKFQVSHW